MEKAEDKVDIRRTRILHGPWYFFFIVLTGIGGLLSINQIFNLKFFVGFVLMDNSFLYALVGIFISLVFLIFPANKRSGTFIPWYDYCLFILTIIIFGYYAITGLRSIQEGWEFASPPLPVTFAFFGWVLVLEAVRRTSGLVILIIFTVLSLYPVYTRWLPSILSGMPQSIVDTARYHLLSEESVLGIPMKVFGTLIVGFIIFGTTLQSTGGGKFFINIAFALLGGYRGGPAKVAIVASGLFGSLSGSVISNVLTTGAMTIPAMKKTGYPPRCAGGIEACASTGGVLMPPVMGATAFVMASFLDIPYTWVALAAVIPSFLYFYGLFIQIDSYAARHNIKGMSKDMLPSVREVLKDGWYYLFGFLLLIYLLIYLKRESQAPFFAAACLLALSQLGKLNYKEIWFYILGGGIVAYLAVVLSSVYFSPTYASVAPVIASASVLILSHLPKHIRVSNKVIIDFIFDNGRLLAELVAILASVGLIIGGLMLTGIPATFSSELVRLAGGKVIPLLIMGAITSFILGIGMTVTAAYIFLAIVLAPSLVNLGLDPLAVHLFILYWAMVSFITPPVAIGAYAAASLADADPIKTGFEAMRLGSVIYFLPFFFVLNPTLILHGDWLNVFYAVVTAIIGVTMIASGLQGYLMKVGFFEKTFLAKVSRGLLILGGLLLSYPGSKSDVVGLSFLLLAVLIGKAINRGVKIDYHQEKQIS